MMHFSFPKLVYRHFPSRFMLLCKEELEESIENQPFVFVLDILEGQR